MRKILGFICFLFIQKIAWGQWQKVAQPYQDKMNYYSAAKAYAKVLDSGNVDDFIRYTRVLYNQGKYRETYENYKLMASKNQMSKPFDLQAFRTCQSILDSIHMRDFDSTYRQLFIGAGIQGFENGLSRINTEYDLQWACFNATGFEDLCPIPFKDGVLFTSSRESVNGELGDYAYNSQPFYDVFFANDCEVKTITGSLSKELPKGINTELHDGPVWYSPQSGLFFITRNLLNKKGTMPMGIFYSVKTAEGWSKLQSLPVNNLNYTVQHPCFVDSTQTLYFSSNRNGGFGGFDLYEMKYHAGNWSEPVNLGSFVNTQLDEVFPTQYKGELYFSSNGYQVAGGLDIFKIRKDGVFVMQNLNTSWDDYGLVFSSDSTGFLTSNRVYGFGKDDILSFSITKIKEDVFIPVYAKRNPKFWGDVDSSILKLAVVDSATGIEIDKPVVVYKIRNKRSGLVTTFNSLHDNSKVMLGYFEKDSVFDIQLEITHPLYHPQYLNYREIKSDTSGMIDLGKISMVRNALPKPKHSTKYPELRPIYFDLDKFVIRKDAKRTLDSIIMVLNEYPAIMLELSSFTDSRASDAYNKRLSENRAKSTFNYLVKHGVARRRLLYSGFGETGLVNDCGDDRKCAEQLHQLNRRTEFTIIER